MDTVLKALGPLGRYQIMTMFFLFLGFLPALYQLLDQVFISRDVKHWCSLPGQANDSIWQNYTTLGEDVNITLSSCKTLIQLGNTTTKEEVCQHGMEYAVSKDMYVNTEFDLVCDKADLLKLSQTLLILGQGIGAVITTIFSDRYGRKIAIVCSNFGMLVCGFAIAFAPNFPVFIVFKFLVGCFQQGVVTGGNTFIIELLPTKKRNAAALFTMSTNVLILPPMSLFAWLFKDLSWRYLHLFFTLSSSFAIIQAIFLDESIRWLVANGKETHAKHILKKAAKINRKDVNEILQLFEGESERKNSAVQINSISAQLDGEDVYNIQITIPNPIDSSSLPSIDALNTEKDKNLNNLNIDSKDNNQLNEQEKLSSSNGEVIQSNGTKLTQESGSEDNTPSNNEKVVEKLSLLDLLRHKRLLVNALGIWFAWFTVALGFFALYLTSTSLAGDRFLNFFLVAIMGIPANMLWYIFSNRIGRKKTTIMIFSLMGLALLASGVFSHLAETYPVFVHLNIVVFLISTIGAQGAFDAVFFFTPELFPTNVRNQALGVSSFMGRVGGMLAPFTSNLASVAVWAPGVLIGCFAVIVALLLRLVPETAGRELPHTIEDLQKWYTEDKQIKESGKKLKNKE